MADVLIYHPGTQGQVAVPEEGLHHYRQSGWVTMTEWQEQQAAAAAAPPEAPKPAEETARPLPPRAAKTGKE